MFNCFGNYPEKFVRGLITYKFWEIYIFSNTECRMVGNFVGLDITIFFYFKNFPWVTARELARVVGKIISMSPVMGNIWSIMTRFSSMEIAYRQSWEDILEFTHECEVLNECNFWLQCILSEKKRLYLHTSRKKSVIIYSDASLKKVWAQLGEISGQLN